MYKEIQQKVACFNQKNWKKELVGRGGRNNRKITIML